MLPCALLRSFLNLKKRKSVTSGHFGALFLLILRINDPANVLTVYIIHVD